MRYPEARTGSVFVIRLEPGDRLPDAIERLAADPVTVFSQLEP